MNTATGLLLALLFVVVLVLSGCHPGIKVRQGPLEVHTDGEVEVTIIREGIDTKQVKGKFIEGELYLDGERLDRNDVRYADAVLGIRVVR